MRIKINKLGNVCDEGGTLLHGAQGNAEIARCITRFSHFIVADNREDSTQREELALMLRAGGNGQSLALDFAQLEKGFKGASGYEGSELARLLGERSLAS